MKKKRFVKSMVSVFTAFVMGITTFAAGLPGDIQVVHAETAGVQNQDEIAAEDMNAAAEALGLVADSQEEGVYYNSSSSMTDFRDETIYFVITTRFYDGEPENNEHCSDENAGTSEDDPAWRGDFKGLIEKLDYIKSLGFSAIWITPVVENKSGLDYHGYHAYDFSKVDSRYESPGATYQDLINAAHEKGMKIIQDVVFNHTCNWGEKNLLQINNPVYAGGRSDMTTANGIKDDPESIYHHKGFCGGGDWDNYNVQVMTLADDCFDLETENPKVYNYLIDCYKNYINMGVDAFRVDTVKHLSRLTLNSRILPALMETGGDNFYMFGEVCTKGSNVWYRDQPGISTCFYTWNNDSDWISKWSDTDLSVNEGLVESHYNAQSMSDQPKSNNAFLNGNEYHTPDYSEKSAMNAIDFQMHWDFMNANKAFNTAKGEDAYFNDSTWNVVYVDSHDYAPDEQQTMRYNGGKDAWAENLSLMFTFRGIPCLYYGSEVEFQAGKPIDKGGSAPLADTGRAYFGDYIEGSVNATDFGRYNGATGEMANTLNSPLSLHIQRLNRLRACIPALRKGQYSTEGCNGNIAFKRRYTDADTDSFVLVAVTSDATFTGIPNGKYVDAITGDEKTVGDGTLSTSGIKGQGDLRVYVLDTGKAPFLGMIDGKSQFMSGGTDTVEATSPVQREHGGNEKIPAEGITLDKTSATLDLGETVKLTATVKPDNATNKSVTWSTSDKDVAKVSSGTVTAVSEGTATITAKTSNGLTAVATIIVEAKGIKVESITINKTTATLDAGTTLQLTASVSPADADEKYSALTWKSSDTKVATVDNTGMVTALKAGTATITVSTAYGVSAVATIKVNGPKFNYMDGDAVYFEKPAGWGDKISAYFWTGSGEWTNAGWPGEDMTLLDESAGIYGIKWPEGKTESGMSVIFTDGKGDSTKTADLSAKINGYYNSNGLVKTVDPNEEPEQPGGTTERPGGTTEQPGGTTERPGGTTEQPGGTTEQPGGTTERPGSTTEQPGAVTVSLEDTKFVYDGTPKTPEVTVKSGTATLIKDRDYTVTYRNNTNAGDMNAGDLAPAVIVTCKGNYEGTFEKTFTIKKAAYPQSGIPSSSMNVSKDFEKVSDIKDLPAGWVWETSDSDKELSGGQPVKATAVYNKEDKNNYETISVEVSITKSSDCSHPFGNMETKNSKNATCTGKGYTGDKYCTNCQTTVQSGTEIPALGHSWSSWKVTKQPTATAKGMKVRQCTRVGCTENEEVQFICNYQYPTAAHVWNSGKVTKQPTATANGEKTYTCNVCSAARKETIPATGGGG
ncbi:MAG: Ig-like domain-containing protein, partial [Lachnospiraceae bacterium]|nr:Ig-like domain-containing protein [Lachnospiraceae bacterium]